MQDASDQRGRAPAQAAPQAAVPAAHPAPAETPPRARGAEAAARDTLS